MTRKSVTLLSESALGRIQSESLRLLEQVGIRVDDPVSVEILRRAGARVVGQTNVVQTPAAMVRELAGQTCGVFDVLDLHGRRFPLPSPRPLAGSRLKMPKYLDYGATASRQVRRQDAINLSRVAAALPSYEWSVVIDCPAADGDPAVDSADALALAYAITGQTLLTAPTTVAGMRMCIDLAQAASGAASHDEWPNLMVCVNTTSPLQMAAEEGRVLRCAVEHGVPIDVEPMTTAGGTTPFTLAGTLLVENAEVLFMLCLANLVRPGAKVMASTVGATMNMKGPNLSLAAPEAMLLGSAEAALTRLHGIPVMRMGGYCDSYYLDVQAGIEKAAFGLMIALSGADMVLMGGPLNNAGHQSCESEVIDHDIFELVERCTREIEVDDATLAFDTIVDVGIGGSHLDNRHTLRWLRSGEHYLGGCYNRSGRPGEELTMLARAHERVRQILDRPFQYAAPPEAVGRLRDFVEAQARDAGVQAPEWPQI